MSSRWSQWLFSLDVIRNTKSPKSFLHTSLKSLCPLGAYCLAHVQFEAKLRFWLSLDRALGI